jgi:hypothetical protein
VVADRVHHHIFPEERMAKVKGSGITNLRIIFKEREEFLEQKFLIRLPDKLALQYRGTLPSNWINVETSALIYHVAAPILFPNDPYPIRKLGQAIAKKVYSGVYKLFVRIPSRAFIVKRAAQIWTTHFDTGKGTMLDIKSNSMDFVISDFPEMPVELRELSCGHLAILLNYTGAKNIQVDLNEEDPNAWLFKLTWE